jgi:hypothetical protein
MMFLNKQLVSSYGKPKWLFNIGLIQIYIVWFLSVYALECVVYLVYGQEYAKVNMVST